MLTCPSCPPVVMVTKAVLGIINETKPPKRHDLNQCQAQVNVSVTLHHFKIFTRVCQSLLNANSPSVCETNTIPQQHGQTFIFLLPPSGENGSNKINFICFFFPPCFVYILMRKTKHDARVNMMKCKCIIIFIIGHV